MKVQEEEDRILRVWTPIVLRGSVFASAAVLVAGLVAEAVMTPGYYVERFHDLQRGAELRGSESWTTVLSGAFKGRPHEVLTIGLLLLTLVPLGRVALSLLVFVRERDRAFILLTGYVLAMLIVGVMLGRVG